jgi:hypothetical protein
MAAATLAALAAAASFAIVTQDNTALRAAPSDNAAQQAQLAPGDLLEVRGQKLDHLQVYDHRRERAGYVRATQVRTTGLQPAEAPQLLAVTRFLRDTPGAESLGIAYVAAYLKAAPAAAIDAEPFDALGTMAERLARRASQRQAGPAVAAQLDGVAAYGVRFTSYEHDGALQLCYDGEAFRRVLAFAAASAEQRARAALAVTRADCIDPALPPTERQQTERWRAEVLDRVDTTSLRETLKNRLRLRRAGVWSTIAFDRTRAGESTGAAQAAQRALDELAAIDKTELADDDQADYSEAAVRVGASRWAAEAPLPVPGRLTVQASPGEPGQTCVSLNDGQAALARRCTYGAVWLASARAQADGSALALAVQPLAGWRELWVFRRQAGAAGGWTVDVLPPAASEPGLGYVEFAGFVPGGQKMLLAREARVEGRFKRSFEVVSLDTLNVEKQASTPSLLVLFGKWQDAAWKRLTVSLR